MDLKKIKRAYFIGIKGFGMTALAQVLKEQGIFIMGTDESEIFHTDRVLGSLGIEIENDFATNKLDDSFDLVIKSTAYNDDHPAVVSAREKGYKIMTYPEVLSEIIKTKQSIAISGTHGKTTTTAMLGLTLVEGGVDPTVIVGSEVPQFKSNARVGKSEYLIVEADEYQNKFLDYHAQGAVITSVDYDHPDFFNTPEEYYETFKKFIEQIPADGFLVYCGDDQVLAGLAKEAKCELISYGLAPGNDWRVDSIGYKAGAMQFKAWQKEKEFAEFNLQVPGEHNALNALSAIVVANKLGCAKEKIQKGLAEFRGTVRRFEQVGDYQGARIIDDYAHHPKEVEVTLRSIHNFYLKKNVWCIFQPHTFTRTKEFLNNFAKSFSNADQVIVLDIFGSAREQQGGVHSKDLVKLIKEQGQEVYYQPDVEAAMEFIKDKLGPNDVLITMGAGEAWQVGRRLIEK